MPSKLDPHVDLIKGWLTSEPQLTASGSLKTRSLMARGPINTFGFNLAQGEVSSP